MKKKSIFVVGMPRSGTTLVQSIIGTSDDIYTFPESHIFNKGINIFREKPNSWNVIISNIKVNFRLYQLGFKPIVFRNTTDFVRKIDKTFSADNTRNYVEKTPSHLRMVPIIRKEIPSAKFVFVLRKSDANINSYQKLVKVWGKNIIDSNTTEIELRWLSDRYRILSYFNPSDSIKISYEDIVNSINQNLVKEKLEKFLDIKIDMSADRLRESSERTVEEKEFWKENNKRGVIKSFEQNDKENDKLLCILNQIINETEN